MPKYARTPVPAQTGPESRDAQARTSWNKRFITPNQLVYIKGLVEQRDISSLSSEQQKFLRGEATPLEHLSMAAASKIIDAVKELPRLSHPADQTDNASGHMIGSEVPAGRYAVEENEIVKFFHVDRPTEGRWKGYTFIKIRASDELYRVKELARCKRILNSIAKKGVQKCMEDYGQLLGSCGMCGRTLTDPLSREIGIGPVCRNKVDWY